MHRRVIRTGACTILSRIFSAALLFVFAASGTFAVEDDLQFIVRGFETVAKHNLGTASVPSGVAAAQTDGPIDRDTIISSTALKKELKKTYNANPIIVRSYFGDKDAIDSIEQIEILETSGNTLTLKIKYRWILERYQRTGIDYLVGFVDILPTFSNFQYDEELLMDIEDSHYADIAGFIASLGLMPESQRAERDCQYDHFAPNPCPGTREMWQAFAAREGLELNRDSAKIFRAYVNRRYGWADRLYARVKGYKLPEYSGIGGEFAALRSDLRRLQGSRRECEFNHFSPIPCPGVLKLWREFAERHDLALDPLSAGIFQAFVERDFKRGDRLYAVAKGLPIPGYRGPGESVLAMRQRLFQIQSFRSSKGGCVFNHFDPNPCPQTLLLWRQFAEKNGFELNLASADIFEAYAGGNYRRGDRLYARATGVPVDQLANPNIEPPPPPMIIDIHPSNPDASMLPAT